MEESQIKESQAVIEFRKKTQIALDKLSNYKQFEESEPMVMFVMDAGRKLFVEALDQWSPAQLLHYGGKLSGIYSYLGQRSAQARAERDVYEQKLDEMEKEYFLRYRSGDENVTDARAKVVNEVGELKNFVIQKDSEKNQWENILEACDKMVSFIQSAIKVKEGERYQSGRLQDNG